MKRETTLLILCVVLLAFQVSPIYCGDSSGTITVGSTEVDSVMALALFGIILAITLPVSFYALSSNRRERTI